MFENPFKKYSVDKFEEAKKKADEAGESVRNLEANPEGFSQEQGVEIHRERQAAERKVSSLLEKAQTEAENFEAKRKKLQEEAEEYQRRADEARAKLRQFEHEKLDKAA